MQSILRLSVYAGVIAFASAASASAEKITYGQLLDSMVDLKALALRPDAEEFCRQFSSYDRATRWDEAKKAIVGNDANGDYGQYLRVEPAGHIMADMEGPGCIDRIWSANADGTIRIFIDGEEKPRLDVEMQKLLGGKIEPLTGPISGVRSQGWNLYLPIPYQKSCKVAVRDAKNPKSIYYQVTYRTYPKGTELESFRWPLPEEWVRGIEKVKGILSKPGSQLEGRNLREMAGPFIWAPGQTTSSDPIPGPAAIVGAEITFDDLPSDPKVRREVLRKALVTARFDDEENAIWAPLGDLFGTAPDLNPYPGYPAGITKEGKAYLYWTMPFQREAVVRLKNLGDRAISGTGRFLIEPMEIPKEKMLYFHADWRYEGKVSQFDWPLLVSAGAGRYCGTALYVFNPQTGWWGEGDEKMWIDGENFPSTIGTGSEDYFGYAWCCPVPFFNAFHNQPLCEGPGNGNYTSVNRFQFFDNVPFHKSARITIEAYNRGSVTYAATTYWYGSAGATTDSKPVDLAAIQWPEPFKPFKLEGAIEGEKLKLLSQNPKFEIGEQDISGHGQFSRGKQVWFRATASGATAEFAIPGDVKPGKYRATLWIVCSWDYGIVQWSLNGKPLGDPVDAFSPAVVAKKVDGGVVEIREGENRLDLKIAGKNEKSTGYFAGLDALKLEPVQ